MARWNRTALAGIDAMNANVPDPEIPRIARRRNEGILPERSAGRNFDIRAKATAVLIVIDPEPGPHGIVRFAAHDRGSRRIGIVGKTRCGVPIQTNSPAQKTAEPPLNPFAILFEMERHRRAPLS